MSAWLKANWRALALAVSLSLNVLGGSGIVPPVLAKTFQVFVTALPQ